MADIYIKAYYGDWHPASIDEALSFARELLGGMTSGCTQREKTALVNRHIRGIQFALEDLTNGTKDN